MSQPEHHHWRLIVEQTPRSGAWNMAIDRALMESAGSLQAPPTLRIYSWEPAAITLGKGQPEVVVDSDRCTAAAIDVVRRPTGGWAILHADEMTYSVVAHADEPVVAGPLLEAYRVLSAALITGLGYLGLDAMLAPAPSSAEKSGLVACFEVPYNNEITVGGKKLMGSAQARTQRRLLQHGSLPLFGDVGRVASYLVFADEAARTTLAQRLHEHATTASAAAGRTIDYTEAAAAITRGFATTLPIDLEPGDLTAAELERATAIVAGAN